VSAGGTFSGTRARHGPRVLAGYGGRALEVPRGYLLWPGRWAKPLTLVQPEDRTDREVGWSAVGNDGDRGKKPRPNALCKTDVYGPLRVRARPSTIEVFSFRPRSREGLPRLPFRSGALRIR